MSPRIPYGVWLIILGALLLMVGLSWQPSLAFSTRNMPPLIVPALISLVVGFVNLWMVYQRKSKT